MTLKITQIKAPKYSLVFQKHLLKNNEDFNHEQYRKSTELSKYTWSLKQEQLMSRIRWSIFEKVFDQTKMNFCPLCLAEQVHLIEHFNEYRLLNKRNEFISGCRHQVKLLLKIFKGK